MYRTTTLTYALSLFLGLVLVLSGCAPSNPNLSDAESALGDGNYEQAIESINLALEEEPDNADIYRTKLRIYRQWAQNTDDLDQRTERFRQAREAMDQLIEMDSDFAELMEEPELRVLDDDASQFEAAVGEEFEKAVEAFQRGQQNQAAYDSAAAYFYNVSVLMPELRDAHVNRAYALINADRPAEAIDPFERALERGAEMAREIEELQASGEWDELPEEERQQMQDAVEEDADLYVFISSIYAQEDRLDDAVDTLERGQERFPGNADIQEQLLNAYVQSGQIDRAKQQYAQAVEDQPENATYRYNYGSLLLEAGEYDAAIEELTRAAELDPDNADAHYNIGAAYINQAADVNERIRDLDDELRETQAELSQEEIQAMEAEIDELVEERRDFFEQAVEPLERARELSEPGSEQEITVCSALIQVYGNTGRDDEAREAQECADQTAGM